MYVYIYIYNIYIYTHTHTLYTDRASLPFTPSESGSCCSPALTPSATEVNSV